MDKPKRQPPITCRPSKDKYDMIVKFVKRQAKIRKQPVSKYIECLILDAQLNTTIYEPKNKK